MATERGSARMLRERGREVPEVAIDAIARLNDNEDAKLVRWLTKGTPRIDAVQGTFHTSVAQAGPIVSGLLETGVLGHIKVFPNGIPALDGVAIEFGTELS